MNRFVFDRRPMDEAFLQITFRAFNQTKTTIDCFFPQFEYEGHRAMFESNHGEVSDAVNDSLATITVSQDEYVADYKIQFYSLIGRKMMTHWHGVG